VAAVRQTIGQFQPEVIALSIRNVDDQSMQETKFLLEPVRDVVAACRAACPAKLVVGGAGYSIFPETALAYLDADYGVCGEGEVAFPSLLERLQRGQHGVGLPGLYSRGGRPPATRIFAQDLDLLPLPEADLWASADGLTTAGSQHNVQSPSLSNFVPPQFGQTGCERPAPPTCSSQRARCSSSGVAESPLASSVGPIPGRNNWPGNGFHPVVLARARNRKRGATGCQRSLAASSGNNEVWPIPWSPRVAYGLQGDFRQRVPG
jgi:hypothetical protein